MMEEMMLRYETFARHAPYMEKLSIDQNRVVLKDNKRNRIAEVLLKEGELQCLLDERADCVHVGCAYSLPELYIMNNEIRSINPVVSFASRCIVYGAFLPNIIIEPSQ
jgi:hypothetical protein